VEGYSSSDGQLFVAAVAVADAVPGWCWQRTGCCCCCPSGQPCPGL